MTYEVRRIRPDEWPLFKTLRLEALRDSPTAFIERYDESVTKEDEFWIARVSRGATSDDTASFGAFSPDGADPARSMIAKAAVFLEPDEPQRTAHVVGVYACPEARGTGAAADVVTAAITWARSHLRPDVVHLYVTSGKDRAAAFYRRLGFVQTDRQWAHPHHPGLIEHEMVLKTDPRP